LTLDKQYKRINNETLTKDAISVELTHDWNDRRFILLAPNAIYLLASPSLIIMMVVIMIMPPMKKKKMLMISL